MADKVLRFTAEDSGYGQTIDRMAAKLRTAFSGAGGGMSDILAEADSKFTNFSDKLKFIRSELNTIKEANEQERIGAVKEGVTENIRTGYKRSNDAVQKEISKDYEREEKSINRLVEALDKFGDRVEQTTESGEQPGKPGEPGGPPATLPPRNTGGGEGGGGGGFLVGALTTAIGFGLERLAEGALHLASNAIKEGVQLARTENQQRTFLPFNENAVAPYELGVSNREYIEARGKYALSRRSGTNIDEETLNRLRLLRSNAAVSDEQLGGLDRFYRVRQGAGGGDLLDKSQYDATRTISEIIARAERQGILGVSKGDFTMLPEKIGQVTSIMNQQYNAAERTNANAAINLTLAGQRIGGRFADDRAADTFGKLNEGITNPRSPGMRAFIMEVLRRQNPGKSPLELEAQMQNGLSDAGNLKGVFGAIQNVRSPEVRGRILQSMGLDAQSAIRLAQAPNLQAFLQQAGQQGLTTTQFQQFQKDAQTKAEAATLATDKAGSYFSNAVTAFGESVVKFVDGVAKSKNVLDQTVKSANSPGVDKNKIIAATPFGPIYQGQQ